MSTEVFNPSDCLARLHKIAEEIPLGVREDATNSILPVESSEELLAASNSIIVSAVKKAIDNFWVGCNISEKLHHLKEIQEKSPSTEKAWRPVTGDVEMKPILASALRERKKLLEEELKITREQLDILKPYISDCRDKLEKQIVGINEKKNVIISENKVPPQIEDLK